MLFPRISDSISSAAKIVTSAIEDGASGLSSFGKSTVRWLSPQIYDLYKNFQTSGTSLICIALGSKGAGKTEFVCVFDDLEKSFFGLSGEKHASGVGGELKKRFSTSGMMPIGNRKIEISDGVGTAALLPRRFAGFTEFLEKAINNDKVTIRDSSLRILCAYLVDLRDNLTSIETLNRFRAELRLFRRMVVEHTLLVKQKNEHVRVKPSYVIIGSHLDEVRSGEEKEGALLRLTQTVFEHEQVSADFPYKVVSGDLYSEEGRSRFLKGFFEMQHELGV